MKLRPPSTSTRHVAPPALARLRCARPIKQRFRLAIHRLMHERPRGLRGSARAPALLQPAAPAIGSKTKVSPSAITTPGSRPTAPTTPTARRRLRRRRPPRRERRRAPAVGRRARRRRGGAAAAASARRRRRAPTAPRDARRREAARRRRRPDAVRPGRWAVPDELFSTDHRAESSRTETCVGPSSPAAAASGTATTAARGSRAGGAATALTSWPWRQRCGAKRALLEPPATAPPRRRSPGRPSPRCVPPGCSR